MTMTGIPLDVGTVRAFEQHYGTRVFNGRYGYDSRESLRGGYFLTGVSVIGGR